MSLGRQEAVDVLQEGHTSIMALADRLSDVDFARPATIGGGDWSAQDLVAHLTTWEEMALEALEQWRQGMKPTVETEVFGTEGGVDDVNAKTVEAKRAHSAEQIREASVGVQETLVQQIGDMSDEEWNGRAPYQTERRRHLFELLGSILGAPKRPFGHAFAHVEDLRAYVESLT
jgi:hypothetical protein